MHPVGWRSFALLDPYPVLLSCSHLIDQIARQALSFWGFRDTLLVKIPRMPSTAPAAPCPPPLSPLLQDLNAEQLSAVTLPATGHALVLAGAGSGKTRVLTTRIAWLLQTGQATPGGILALTFTNKAAREMLTRLSALLPYNVRGMWIGTFHGLCNRLLRAHHQSAGLPATFQILDTQDQLSAIKRLCKQFQVDEAHFPPKPLQYFIANCKEEGLRPGDVPAPNADARKKIEIYQLYEAQCQREGVVDFGELILRSYELLRDNAALRAHYQRRFGQILVDEFQDTNRLQYQWLKQMAGEERDGRLHAAGCVMAVGDDDQSIYAFRGARVDNMQDFVREFGIHAPIKLEQNYRSHSNILDCANALISHNSQRLGKQLRTTQGAGEPVRIIEAASDSLEAQWMVDEIRQLAQTDGWRLQEIAVLYRSNAQSRVIESHLFNAKINYRVYGGLRFFERAEIKHALAYLRLLENPHDDTSFARVVNFPPRGIGLRSLEILQEAARAAGCSLYAAVAHLTGAAAAKLAGFAAKIDALRSQTQGQSLTRIIQTMEEESGLLAHYRAEKEGSERLENLQELVNAAHSFATQEGFGRDAPALTQSPASQGLDGAFAPPAQEAGEEIDEEVDEETDGVQASEALAPLAAFLTHAALEAGDNQAQAGQDAVQLMTVHASKGLEFDAVFIGGLEEDLFPHGSALMTQGGLEEERRLAYVAITRARKRLYLSHAQTRMLHGQTRYNVKSRFIDELPEEALKWMPPRRGTFAAWDTPAPTAHPARAGARAPAPALASAKHASSGLRTGQAVFHNKFGEGKVLALEGQGSEARAQVHFPRHGTKWLALAVAKLTVVA